MTSRILLIDDSIDIHDLLGIMLLDEPLELLSATSGVQGIEMARREAPDLILLDVEMPAFDGFAVCQALKADSLTSEVPIIFLSGITTTAEKIRGLDLGAVDYVSKPFDPAELRARVGAALRTKRLTDMLAKRAMLDGLTGLWNRRYFDIRLETELANRSRHGCTIGCAILDIDHFKSINDTYGHPVGDAVICGVAQILTTGVREGDVVARIGGEEFAILTSDPAEYRAASLAERLRLSIENFSLVRGRTTIRVTCSFGVAKCSPIVRTDCTSLVNLADQALYSAKRSGRNRVVEADTFSAPAPARASLSMFAGRVIPAAC